MVSNKQQQTSFSPRQRTAQSPINGLNSGLLAWRGNPQPGAQTVSSTSPVQGTKALASLKLDRQPPSRFAIGMYRQKDGRPAVPGPGPTRPHVELAKTYLNSDTTERIEQFPPALISRADYPHITSSDSIHSKLLKDELFELRSQEVRNSSRFRHPTPSYNPGGGYPSKHTSPDPSRGGSPNRAPAAAGAAITTKTPRNRSPAGRSSS